MTHAKTKGTWHVEPHDDGSFWVVGPDPQDGRKVCVAAFEMEQDAHHVCQLHNQHERQMNIFERSHA